MKRGPNLQNSAEFRQHSSDRLDEEPSTFGRWTSAEHALFLEGLRLHNRNWPQIAKLIGTRNTVQTRTHAQKYFIKQDKRNGVIRPHSNSYLHPEEDYDHIDESARDVAAILIGSLMHATTKDISPPDHTPTKKQRVSHLIGDDCDHAKGTSRSGNASVLLDAIYGVYNHSEQSQKPVVHCIPEDSDDYHSPSENDHDHSNRRSAVTHEAVSRLGSLKNVVSRNAAIAPQYNNNYITYNIQLPPKNSYSAPPASSPIARTTPASRHLSKKDRYELVQRAQQLEAQRPAVRGLQSLLATEFDVCPTTVYHILKSRDRIESDYEQRMRLSEGPSSQSSISISTQPSEVVLPEELSPSSSPLDVSTASDRLRMYEAYQPEVQHGLQQESEEVRQSVSTGEAEAKEDVGVKTEVVVDVDQAAPLVSSVSLLSSAEAVAQQVAIMSRFEEIVAEQLDAHNVVTTAEAHKYTEWYATYYGIKTLEGDSWHSSDEWFERFNAVYMDGRFVE